MRTSPLFNKPHSVMPRDSTWLGPWRFPDGLDADLWVWSNSHLMVVWGERHYIGLATVFVPWTGFGDFDFKHTEGHEGAVRTCTLRMAQAQAGLRAAAARVCARALSVRRGVA